MTFQPGRELRGPERRAPGRGQLDGQRHAIRPGAHLGDRGRVACAQREPRAGRAGPGDEQGAGLGPGDRTGRAVLGQAERWDREDGFAGNKRGIGQGGQFDQPGAVLEARLSQRRHPQCQPGLAAPAGTGQRDHSGRAEPLTHTSYLGGAAHQRAQLGRQPRLPPRKA